MESEVRGDGQTRARKCKRCARIVRGLAVAMTLGAAACGTRSLLQRAEVLGAGESRLSLGVFGGLATDSLVLTPSAGIEIDYRLGVGSCVDLDARIWPIGGRLAAKFELARRGRAILSTEVSLVGSAFPTDPVLYYVGGQVSLLLGITLGEHELVLAGVVAPGFGEASTSDDQNVYRTSGFSVEGGLSLGADFALSRLVHLMPEFGVFARGGEQRDVQSIATRDPFVFHGALSVAFEF